MRTRFLLLFVFFIWGFSSCRKVTYVDIGLRPDVVTVLSEGGTVCITAKCGFELDLVFDFLEDDGTWKYKEPLNMCFDDPDFPLRLTGLEYDWIKVYEHRDSNGNYQLHVYVSPNESDKDRVCMIGVNCGDSGDYCKIYQNAATR